VQPGQQHRKPAGGHQQPPQWLKPGDVVEVEVPQIGVLRNEVIDEV